jgi:hypothetical protein
MNKRQALRAVTKQLEEYEAIFEEQARLLNLYRTDVKNFYECIEGTVDGESICKWCNDHEECQLQAKDGKGCKEWQHIIQQPLVEVPDEG